MCVTTRILSEINLFGALDDIGWNWMWNGSRMVGIMISNMVRIMISSCWFMA